MSGPRVDFLKCLLIGLFAFLASAAEAAPNGPPALHFPLFRRGGPFAQNRTADLDLLKEQLAFAEARFNLTQRKVHGNKIVRTPKDRNAAGGSDGSLIGEIGRLGNWYALKLSRVQLVAVTDTGFTGSPRSIWAHQNSQFKRIWTC